MKLGSTRYPAQMAASEDLPVACNLKKKRSIKYSKEQTLCFSSFDIKTLLSLRAWEMTEPPVVEKLNGNQLRIS